MRTYHVTYEHDEGGWWVATVKEAPACHTQGRTIAQTRNRLREAMGLFVKDAETAAFAERIKVSAAAKAALAEWFALRQKEEDLRQELRARLRDAVQALVRSMGVSVRDAGAILDLSHQRVHQLAAELGATEGRRPRRARKQPQPRSAAR